MENKKELLVKEHEEFLTTTEGHLDLGGQFIPGEMIAERLGITEKTLIMLANSGEFELGRVAGRIIVDKPTFMAYLDRNHFRGIENESEEVAIDSKGRLKQGLTLVGEPHSDVPSLKPIHDFAIRLSLDDRSFMRHCETGTFPHYRIGTNYKLSEEDWIRGLKRITEKGMKSNRGGKRSSGRPLKFSDKVQGLLTGGDQGETGTKKAGAKKAAAKKTTPKAGNKGNKSSTKKKETDQTNK